MSEQLRPEIVEVDALLRRVASGFAYPPTPVIAAAVASRLREPASAAAPAGALLDRVRVWWNRPLLRLAAGTLAAALLVVGAAVAIPQSRTALAELFGLSHVRVEVGPSPGPTPRALSPDSFARPATVASAQEVVAFPLRFPTRDGEPLRPDSVYLEGADTAAPVVIFVYEDEAFDLYQSKGAFYGKGGLDAGLVRQIEFAGHAALWIDQGGHVASFLDEQGRVVVESRRSVERATLLWEEGEITYRLETSVSQEEAIRIADSLR
ncbi:MAG: hypothetical protein IH866_02760 [Chloroflexi bacterium]|nr:hypothetical protein [Chloroflexota bacterium]